MQKSISIARRVGKAEYKSTQLVEQSANASRTTALFTHSNVIM